MHERNTDELRDRSANPMRSATDSFCREYGLSPREQDVLEESIWGYSMVSIGEKLFISRDTVKTHLRHIYQKTDCHSKSELTDLVRSYLANR